MQSKVTVARMIDGLSRLPIRNPGFGAARSAMRNSANSEAIFELTRLEACCVDGSEVQ